MSANYKDEIFKYLTSKDNFTSAFEVYQLFPDVRNRLIEQLWLKVKENLVQLTKETAWDVDISDNIFETYSYLGLFQQNKSLWVLIEQIHKTPYYGLWLEDNNLLDRDQLNKYVEENIKNENHLYTIKTKGDWIGWNNMDINYESLETLRKLLPENYEIFAEEIATMIFEFAEELKEDITKMEKMTTNKTSE